MAKTPLTKLQRLIDATVRHGARYHTAQAALNDFCRNHYGQEPGDIDADQIIDAVFGGCGIPVGMAASDFDEVMRDIVGERGPRS